MLSRKVNTPFPPAQCVEKADLSRVVQRKRALLPSLQSPAVRYPAFERFRQFGKDLARLIERRTYPVSSLIRSNAAV